MDELFSQELRELIAKSRKIAIEYGYDYISTIHFFLADCESNYSHSIKNFAFQTEEEYIKFRDDCKLTPGKKLDLSEADIPITIEAEKTIIFSEKLRKKFNQKLTSSSHLLLSALSIKDSMLFSCFSEYTNPSQELLAYYRNVNEPSITTRNKHKINSGGKKGLVNRILNYLNLNKSSKQENL